MGYRCEQCGGTSPKNQACIKKVIKTRQKFYYPKGVGFETVKEIKICPTCAKK